MAVQNLNSLIKDIKTLAKKYQAEFLPHYDIHIASQLNRNSASRRSFLEDYGLENRRFDIGRVAVKNPVVSAPLAGISDNTYRIFTSAFGSALNYTEMISSYGLYYNHRESLSLANISDFERPCGVQLFGSEPEIMLEAALKIEENADFIDINMGCPVPKIIKTKSGGYLLNDEERISRIIKKISSKIEKPLTVKLRLGWDNNSINVLRVARIAENDGAAAIAVHGRTVRQGFSGEVDYRMIKKVKESVSIPVLVSGNIDSFRKAKDILDITGCNAVMIGRASKGTPWIFFNIAAGFAGLYPEELQEDDFSPSLEWKKDMAMLYLRTMIHFKGQEKAIKEYRKCISWIFKGTRGIGMLKQGFFSIETLDDVFEQINII